MMRREKLFLLSLVVLVLSFAFGCYPNSVSLSKPVKYNQTKDTNPWKKRDLPRNAHPVLQKVINDGIEQTKLTNIYDPNYTEIPYPNGDVPIEKGVCTDVVIRAFRKGGVDLQKEVHEDMAKNFSVYPKIWGLSKPDTNIDHRRVPNLQTFFKRKGKSLPATINAEEYLPGDVITWEVAGLPHIGLVTNLWSEQTGRYIIVHNIGAGVRLEDRLFDWEVTGHYRYF
jgi:hypothetical protein